VCDELINAHLKLYFLFNGWTIYNSKHSLTSICVYYFNYKGKVVNYLIALLKQLNCYIKINYTTVIGDVLAYFKITKKNLSYFIINNAKNNNTYLDYLVTVFNFKKNN